MVVNIVINKSKNYIINSDSCINWPAIVLDYILDYKCGRFATLEIAIDCYLLDVRHLITVLK